MSPSKNDPQKEETINDPKKEETINDPKEEETINDPKEEETINDPKEEETINDPKKKENTNDPQKPVSKAQKQGGSNGEAAFTGEEHTLVSKGPLKLKVNGPEMPTFSKKALKRVVTAKNPSIELLSAGGTISRAIDMIDTYDRKADAFTEGTYSYATTYRHGLINETGKRIPRAGACAGAGVGKARAEYRVFDAEANGPNVYAGAEANIVGVGAMARAEIGSASVGAGPFYLSLGLGIDTGIRAGVDGFEIKFLGCGFNFGPKTSVSFFGSSCGLDVLELFGLAAV
ncbi:hypothetical protein GDO81_017595 [Engystomops pustulosus]|uniref:Uncharacterized protein n=1 Tax=Engystomops pustulosus TaxID=76066 RepID=A0AAV7A319_ENGPU|nr:hypothetical protein GDO81_017595 [Engystomops pustulosus]